MSPPRRWMPLPTSTTALIDVGKAEASSRAGVLPDADSFTNRNITGNKDVAAESGGAGELSSGSTPYVCSEGSACLDGDLGVYCECYYPQRTINSSKQVTRISAMSFFFCFVPIASSSCGWSSSDMIDGCKNIKLDCALFKIPCVWYGR